MADTTEVIRTSKTPVYANENWHVVDAKRKQKCKNAILKILYVYIIMRQGVIYRCLY